MWRWGERKKHQRSTFSSLHFYNVSDKTKRMWEHSRRAVVLFTYVFCIVLERIRWTQLWRRSFIKNFLCWIHLIPKLCVVYIIRNFIYMYHLFSYLSILMFLQVFERFKRSSSVSNKFQNKIYLRSKLWNMENDTSYLHIAAIAVENESYILKGEIFIYWNIKLCILKIPDTQVNFLNQKFRNKCCDYGLIITIVHNVEPFWYTIYLLNNIVFKGATLQIFHFIAFFIA